MFFILELITHFVIIGNWGIRRNYVLYILKSIFFNVNSDNDTTQNGYQKINPGKQCKDTHVFSQIMKMQIINILLHK